MNRDHLIKLGLIAILAVLVFKFGVMAFFENDPKNTDWASNQLDRAKDRYDVIVLGEEPEGIAAAVAAARMGARTLLVCEGQDLGGVFSRSMLGSLEINFGENGQLLNKGIFSEFYNKLGNQFTIEEYIARVKKLVKGESEHLDVLYHAVIGAPQLDGNTLTGINISVDGENTLYPGSRFVDATLDGKVLRACGVPRFAGSEDLNMKGSFLPLKFNFLVKAPSRAEMRNAEKAYTTSGSAILAQYETSNVKIRVDKVTLYDQANETAVVSGINIIDVDPTDPAALKKAYQEAIVGAKDLIAYLNQGVAGFGGIEFVKGADEFYIREKYHYTGEYTLSVNDILDNRNFPDKIALGAYPIDAGKFVDYHANIVGRPTRYSIPLECIIPLKIDNLLMVGSKSSYSSLASSSAGTISVNVSTGEAAGVAAVYTLTKEISPRALVKSKDEDEIKDFVALLQNEKAFLPDFEVEEKNAGNAAFQSVRELRNIGLIASGLDNNYYYAEEATQEDLALLLLNGVYRLAPKEYSLALDSRIRKYFTGEKLTKDKAGAILAALYGVAADTKGAYIKACERGYIDEEMQLKLKDASILKREDVYMLAAYNIKMRTGDRGTGTLSHR